MGEVRPPSRTKTLAVTPSTGRKLPPLPFYTPDLYARLSNEATEAAALAELIEAHPAYYRRLQTLRGIIPEHTLGLAELSGMEDGLLFHTKRDGSHLSLTLRVGNIPIGYADLNLIYHEAQISAADERTLAEVIATTRAHQNYEPDLRAHELDLAPSGEIEHYLLFRTGLTVTIRCRALDWTLTPRPDRHLP